MNWLPYYIKDPLTHPAFENVVRDPAQLDHFIGATCAAEDKVAHITSGNWELIGNATAYLLRNALAKHLVAENIPHSEMEPDVSVQFRCGDILKWSIKEYGILGYSFFKKHIGTGKKLKVVIETTPKSRTTAFMANDKATQRDYYLNTCSDLVDDMVAYIRSLGHDVEIADGEDRSLAWARMVFARKLLCSSSSFCLWPAIASKNAFFPATPLLGPNVGKDISPGWHWYTGPWMSSEQIHKKRMKGADIIKWAREN